MIVVDASIWVSLLVPADNNHIVTRAWARRHFPAGEAPIVPRLAFVEVAGALSRRLGDPDAGLRAIADIKQLTLHHVVEMDEALLDDAARLAATLGLRGADATYVAAARLRGVPLLTWDREQADRARTVVRVQTPD